MKLLKLLKNNQSGVALIWALIFLMIFSILGMSMLFLSRQDILETVNQREDVRAYYLADSGIDLAYAALMKKLTPSDEPLIKSYQDDHNKVYTQQILVGDDTIDITIESVSVDSKWWVKVTSVGTVTETNATETTIVRINVGMDNFVHLIREQ